VKKTELKDFCHVRSNGIYAISIEQGDELVAASLPDGQQIVFLATNEARRSASTKKTSAHGPQAYGVWGIRMEKGDHLVGMATTRRTSRRPGRAAKAAADAAAGKPPLPTRLYR